MGDIGEWPAMNESGRMFEGLNEVRRYGFLKQNAHGAVGVDFARMDWRTVLALADNDCAEAALQIRHIFGKAEDRHDFRRDRDVESRLARRAVS